MDCDSLMQRVQPQKVNRGGSLSAEQIIGRDKLIARLWRNLATQSIVLDAERRMGKTSICRKMQVETRPDSLIIFRDLEYVGTPAEFAAAVLEDVDRFLTGKQRILNRVQSFIHRLGGAEAGIKDIKVKLAQLVEPHWKELLAHTIGDLVEHQEEKVVIFFWDEVPWMRDKIRLGLGEKAAMELLDHLRYLRQTHPTLRMVFTGSVGLHHIFATLRKGGYGNVPTNDMLMVEVPPLETDEATLLALNLLTGEEIPTVDACATAQCIAETVSGMPFLIQHIVGAIADRGDTATIELVDEIVYESLTDANDPWKLREYRYRLDRIYGEDDIPLVLAVLNTLAVTNIPLIFREVYNRLGLDPIPAEEKMRTMLDLLLRDHYLVQERNGAYRFRYPIIARSWRLQRGIGG